MRRTSIILLGTAALAFAAAGATAQQTITTPEGAQMSALGSWIAGQRWFAGKSRRIVTVAREDGVRLGPGTLWIARVTLDDGSWVLVRASSNKPELVVVVESMQGEDDMRALFRNEVKPRLAKFPEVGHYNQEI